jgi:hypothetical protein
LQSADGLGVKRRENTEEQGRYEWGREYSGCICACGHCSSDDSQAGELRKQVYPSTPTEAPLEIKKSLLTVTGGGLEFGQRRRIPEPSYCLRCLN